MTKITVIKTGNVLPNSRIRPVLGDAARSIAFKKGEEIKVTKSEFEALNKAYYNSQNEQIGQRLWAEEVTSEGTKDLTEAQDATTEQN